MNEKRNKKQMGNMGTTHRKAAAALSAAFRQSKNKEKEKTRVFRTAACEEGNQLAALWHQ